MALTAGTVCEIRTTGSQNAGGGFYDRNPGTSVDYSQQDSPQLTLTDLATNGAGTGLSSATGGFTAAMAGNLIRITGGTLTAGWYEIVAYTDTNNVTIDRSAGLSKSGGTGYVGGAFLIGGSLDTDFFAALPLSSVVWIKSGSYTAQEAITLPTGDVSKAPLTVKGYKTSRGDSPDGTDRPLIDMGIYAFTVGNYTHARNLRFTGTGTHVVVVNGYGVAQNILAENTFTAAVRNAFYTQDVGATCVHCEGKSEYGFAFKASSATLDAWHLFACYAHDSVTGIQAGGPQTMLIGCVVDTCTTGITVGSNANVVSCVVYNCTDGISLSNQDYNGSITNTIITGCTNGLTTTATYAENGFRDYNCLNNTNNYVNFTPGEHDIVADPLLNDPANGDFTLATGSPCFAAGLCVGTKVGL
jgi:hypothetical protein